MKLIFSLILIFAGFAIHAQIDSGSKTTSGNIFNSSKSNSKSTSSTFGIPNRKSDGMFLNKNKDKGVDFTAKSKYTDPGQAWDSKFNFDAGKEGNNFDAEKYANDMDFGVINSNAEKMTFMFRDHMAFDGDRVNILLNGEVIAENVLLRPGFTTIDIPMEVGFNKIEFVALNQGQSGPNTAQLRITDDKGYLHSNNVWNLLTGVKASVVIAKQQ
jgi:hypothetical protein